MKPSALAGAETALAVRQSRRLQLASDLNLTRLVSAKCKLPKNGRMKFLSFDVTRAKRLRFKRKAAILAAPRN